MTVTSKMHGWHIEPETEWWHFYNRRGRFLSISRRLGIEPEWQGTASNMKPGQKINLYRQALDMLPDNWRDAGG